jgi:phage tail-like protein
MTRAIGNPQNDDPYGKFAIHLKWEGRYVAGMSRMTAIVPATEVARNSGDSSTAHKLPGRTEYEPITLEHGVTYDKDFEQWANGAWNADSQSGRKTPRMDMLIEIHDEVGKPPVVWSVHQCWVSKIQVLHDRDNEVNAVIIDQITLENEGCERDPGCDP